MTGWRVGVRLGLVHSRDTIGEFEARKILDRLNVNYKSGSMGAQISIPRSSLLKHGLVFPGIQTLITFIPDFYVTSLHNPAMRRVGQPDRFWDVEVQGDSHDADYDELRAKALATVHIETTPIPDRELMSIRGRDLWTMRLKEEFGLEAPP